MNKIMLLTSIIFIFALNVLAQEKTTIQKLDERVKTFFEERRGTWRDMNVPKSDGKLLYDILIKNNYKQALEMAGISLRDDYHGQGEHGRYEAHRLTVKMLSLPERPTAIFAASDTQAMGIMEAARDLNLDIPVDLSVIGYDDIELAEYLGITTVRQLLFESGQRGVDILLNALEKPSMEPECVKLPTELIVRQRHPDPLINNCIGSHQDFYEIQYYELLLGGDNYQETYL